MRVVRICDDEAQEPILMIGLSLADVGRIQPGQSVGVGIEIPKGDRFREILIVPEDVAARFEFSKSPAELLRKLIEDPEIQEAFHRFLKSLEQAKGKSKNDLH